jgi:hypothetical protein
MSEQDATTTAAVDESTADSATTTATATEATTDGTEALGDAGKKALDAMKADRNAARAEARAAADELAALRAQVEGKQAEFEAEKKARELETAALNKANERIRNAELRLAAKGKVNDDMLAALPALMGNEALSAIEVGADGSVDADALSGALSNLLAQMPSLVAQGKRFQGDADGGARKDPAGPSQLTRADMARMTPEQIEAADSNGQFDDLRSGRQ